jgi:hypothetical protein
MASDGMIYVPSFMKIGSSIQVIFNLLPHNFRGCSVRNADGFLIYIIRMVSGGMIYTVACRPIARQRQRNKQLDKGRY